MMSVTLVFQAFSHLYIAASNSKWREFLGHYNLKIRFQTLITEQKFKQSS